MTQYPTLDYFFGGYMHQDWHEDYADEWHALNAFIAEGPPEDPGLFRQEVALLLVEHPSDGEVRKIILDDFCASAMVENRGWKYRDWLQALSDHVGRATGHSQAS